MGARVAVRDRPLGSPGGSNRRFTPVGPVTCGILVDRAGVCCLPWPGPGVKLSASAACPEPRRRVRRSLENLETTKPTAKTLGRSLLLALSEVEGDIGYSPLPSPVACLLTTYVSEIRRRRAHLSRLPYVALAEWGEARFTPVGLVTCGILVDRAGVCCLPWPGPAVEPSPVSYLPCRRSCLP